MKKGKIYLIGIGGIGISAIARYYNSIGYEVYGSDKSDSEIITSMKNEGINIIIGERPEIIDNSFKKVIYTEAIPSNQSEISKAKDIGIENITYPESLAEITENKILIAICGTHGKSTTTSLISLILKNSDENFTSVVGTLLKEFGNKNFFNRKEKKDGDDFFVIEACEYKRSFLKYKPSVVVITNIELDHLDYYKNLEDYISAYRQFIDNMKSGGFVILNSQDKNSRQLINYRHDVNYIIIDNDKYVFNGQEYVFPEIILKVPGEHILYDSRLAFIVGEMIGIEKDKIVESLGMYDGVWRRMEKLGETNNGNVVISDYGHHPTEIKLTLSSIKLNNLDKKILTVFQPHQYNRTIELIDTFKDCFGDSEELIIPNIYESRDSDLDKKNMSTEKFVKLINHTHKINGNGLDNTLKLINDFDEKNKNSIIILMGAGDIDNLRYKIKFKD